MLVLRALSGILDLVAPRLCAACAVELLEEEAALCGGCSPLIERLCDDEARLDRSAAVFGGPLRDALHRCKYQGVSRVAADLAPWMLQAAEPWAGLVDVVTAVPLHPSRLRERGFNQSALLASPVAGLLGAPLRLHWLRRHRDTPAQVGRSPARRAANVREAFRADPRFRGLRVLVVDDVWTTGATLTEVRGCLRGVGAGVVRTLTLGRADTPGSLAV